MTAGQKLVDVVAAGTPDGMSKREFGALLTLTARTLSQVIHRPRRSAPNGVVMEMIFARTEVDNAVSLSLLNLRQAHPLNPRFIKDAFVAGGAATGATIMGAAHFFAFIAAVTVFASRTVPRSEALTLHLAWKIARADRSFTLSDMMEHAAELQIDYEVDKVGEADIVSYLNNLVRAGSLRSAPRGYEVVERIALGKF